MDFEIDLGGMFGGSGKDGAKNTPRGTRDYGGSVILVLSGVVGSCRRDHKLALGHHSQSLGMVSQG